MKSEASVGLCRFSFLTAVCLIWTDFNLEDAVGCEAHWDKLLVWSIYIMMCLSWTRLPFSCNLSVSSLQLKVSSTQSDSSVQPRLCSQEPSYRNHHQYRISAATTEGNTLGDVKKRVCVREPQAVVLLQRRAQDGRLCFCISDPYISTHWLLVCCMFQICTYRARKNIMCLWVCRFGFQDSNQSPQ